MTEAQMRDLANRIEARATNENEPPFDANRLAKAEAIKIIVEEMEDWDGRFDSAETIAESIYERLWPAP